MTPPAPDGALRDGPAPGFGRPDGGVLPPAGHNHEDTRVVDELAAGVHRAIVADALDPRPGATIGRSEVAELVRAADPLLPTEQVAVVVTRVLARTRGLGALSPLLADDAVAEVMVNGDGSVWLERNGRLQRTGVHLGFHEVMGIIERVLAPRGLRVDRRHPVVDARLDDGSRMHVVIPPVAVDGPCVTIRRFRARAVPLTSFAGAATVDLLGALVRRRCNIVVSGGTGAGKTTLLNALAACIGPSDRLVTIEDTAELRLPGDHVVRLEARPAGDEGAPAIGIAHLVRTALRMRPDRIVVGEVRGAEARAMLVAMNTGHEGSLSTVHANSPPDALRRLEVMAMGSDPPLPLAVVREHLAAAVDVVVQVARTGNDLRRVEAVHEVVARRPDGGPLATRLLADGPNVVAEPLRWRRPAPVVPMELPRGRS